MTDLQKEFVDELESNKDKLFRICLVYAQNYIDAEDLFQEVVFQIWRSLPNFKRESQLYTWMYRITLNVSISYQSKNNKKQKRHTTLDGIILSKSLSHHDESIESEDILKLRSCIESLKDGDKSIITLYLEELPYKEIGEILGISENYVAVKIKRIKEKLFNCLD